MRTLDYAHAIKEALLQLMRADERIVLLGQGLDSPWSFGDTTLNLIREFGMKRVFDVPISEAGITGAAAGAAMAGLRPIVMHPRMDFMYLAMDQIVNHAANWYYMFGGQVSVPMVIRGVVNRGNEQGAQHSQSPHALYAHVPGLKVVMPATPEDAKGLLVSAVRDPNPVIYIDDRWLYCQLGPVSEELYSTPIGKGVVRREGTDLTLVAISYTLELAQRAAQWAETEGISIELIDPRTIKPLDMDLINASVAKTGRLLVVDSGWTSFGVSAEIITRTIEGSFHQLKSKPARLASPDFPVPAAVTQEREFFVSEKKIINAIREVIR